MKAREAGKMNALGTQIQGPAHLVTERGTAAPGQGWNSAMGCPVVELADLTGRGSVEGLLPLREHKAPAAPAPQVPVHSPFPSGSSPARLPLPRSAAR